MEGYATFEYYQESFKGSTIPEATFDNLAMRARVYIDMATLGRITDITDDVKMANCAAAEVLHKRDQRDGVSSESVGKHNVVYETKETARGEMYSAIAPYLVNTGLLSRSCHSWGW